VRTTYRPDAVTDPDQPGFRADLLAFGEMTGVRHRDWAGMIEAHRRRRAAFRAMGATATDHGAPSASPPTSPAECQRLLDGALAGR
jgi:glucuronate isomerase